MDSYAIDVTVTDGASTDRHAYVVRADGQDALASFLSDVGEVLGLTCPRLLASLAGLIVSANELGRLSRTGAMAGEAAAASALLDAAYAYERLWREHDQKMGLID